MTSMEVHELTSFRRSSVVMGFPTMLQMKDITAPLPQKRPDLDKLRPQKVDRLIAFTKLTLVLNKVTDARWGTYQLQCFRIHGH